VTAPPKAGEKTAWLARRHAITVLPAVSSLKALRATGRSSAAPEPLVGFGNPLLDGPDSRYVKSAALARDKQSCPKSAWRLVAELAGFREGVGQVEMRNGLANVSHIRRQVPLPETADELCAVARDIGADLGAIHLGAHATEHDVKAMSESGALAKYRIVHFATHGAMAGELSLASEPGLILTPPDTASKDDDGYLSASEIAGLKLDADWVILSACNTAAGQASNAEALSGLARAFIYAQARALLVSHWAVDSNATVKIITSAMREIARDRKVGRAEALRRAMLALIDGADAREAHPSSWAPFILVGEGAL
jgi:CHAT domain-containing protein